jgi:hypothetical protein
MLIMDHSRLVDIGDDLEGSLDAIVLHLASLDGRDVVFTRESQNVEGVLASNRDELAAVGPEDLSLEY